MKSDDIKKIAKELGLLEEQIEYYQELEYSDEDFCTNIVPRLSNGLDEEDFNDAKERIIAILQEKYNKKLRRISDIVNLAKYTYESENAFTVLHPMYQDNQE